MLVFDCLYQNDYSDVELAELAHKEGRILLSRDRRLLMRQVISFGYCLRSLDPLEQLSEVIGRFDLTKRIVPFHRCLRCNHALEPVAKEAILDRLEPLTRLYFDEFQICPACKQVEEKRPDYADQSKQMVADCISATGKPYGDPAGYCFHHFCPFKCKD